MLTTASSRAFGLILIAGSTGNQAVPFQCRVGPAQMSLAETAASALPACGSSGGRTGLGNTDQALPFQCSIKEKSFTPSEEEPTAQALVCESATTESKLLL